MKIGVIADDFTGASDIALTLAEGGMRTAQFVGIPDGRIDIDVEAGVVALASRTIPVADAVQQSLAACDWLIGQGAEQIVFNIPTPCDIGDAGNIGQVAEALAERLDANQVMVCPASPVNGHGVHRGHLVLGDVQLNQGGTQDHPPTPRTGPDLRRLLAQQTGWPVGHIPFTVVANGAQAIVAAFAAQPTMHIVDAITDAEMHVIGKAAAGRKLIVGGSAIALGLPANFGKTPTQPAWDPVIGRGVVLSGSSSRATREQVARFCKQAPSHDISAEAVMQGGVSAAGLADWVLAQDSAPLVFSSVDPLVVAKADEIYGRDALAPRTQALFAELAAILIARGVRRIVVAGEATSAAVVKGLKADVLHIGPRVAAGCPAVRSGDIALALTFDNCGAEDLFAKALHDLGRDP
ncbi:3-oxo-tetronate kinase [Yoonia sp.]|uniref:3-oxo-tetronate kinase n=1 Tax=Yoonia sp. TaxID=2212373 RepID=UPI002FDB907D